MATVNTDTTTPPPMDVGERPLAPDAAQPTANPTRNGQAVEAIPAKLRPCVCTDRPMPTKSSTATRSSTQSVRRMEAQR
jgi:hypothetical protein